MAKTDIIAGKRVLIVDDEKDVLDTLCDLLVICKIDTAASFKEAVKLLSENEYDIAILDIMGVSGFELLEVAVKKDIPVLMLTAHGLSEENLDTSMRKGASYYAPKEEMHRIEVFVADVLRAAENNKNPWIRWLERLGSFYDKRFGGRDWREKEKEFWKQRTKSFD